MAKAESIEKQLEQWRISSDSEEAGRREQIVKALKKLPKTLVPIAMSVLPLEEDSDDDDDNDQDTDPKAAEAKQKAIRALQEKFDQLSAADRKKVFGAVCAQLTDALEDAWQFLKSVPYTSNRAFRTPSNTAATLPSRILWLWQFLRATDNYQIEVITLPWLARWATHAFSWNARCVIPLLAAAISSKGKTGDEVFEILSRTMTREDPVGVVSDHVIQSLLQANRQEGWELLEKTLLAAQRQEGLRQVLLGDADQAHPDAFRRLLRLIVEKDLIRFSSVARSINIWLGLHWDSASTKVLSENVKSLLRLLDSPAGQKKALASGDPEETFRALMAMAMDDAVKAIPHATKLLAHKSEAVRFVAVWFLTLTDLEASQKVKAIAIDDDSLQVALMAAVQTDGIALGELEPDLEQSELIEKGTFDKLEKLWERLPEKPQKLAAIVWPWTERKIDRSMLSSTLVHALGNLPPTRLLPYLKSLNSWEQCQIVEQLSRQKKWDSLTRSTLFELVGHTSADIRKAATKALQAQPLRAAEPELLEGYLTRNTADLRRQVMELIFKEKDPVVLGSADRLLSSGDRNQRLAGLELLRQLAESGRSREACRDRAAAYRAGRKTLIKEEETQIAAIEASDRVSMSFENALGLMNPAGRSRVVLPKKKSVPGITKAAIAAIISLDKLAAQHAQTIVTVRRWGRKDDKPLGEVDSYDLPSFDRSKPAAQQCARFPLFDLWKSWEETRPATTRDKDGLELLRAWTAASLFDDWDYDDLQKFCRKPDHKKLAASILGEWESPKLKYPGLVEGLLRFLAQIRMPASAADHVLDCVENTYAQVPEQMMKELVTPPKKRREWDDNPDWRQEKIFRVWPNMLRWAWPEKPTAEQTRREWELRRFLDEPCPGAPRNRLEFHELATAWSNKLATLDDLADRLLGADTSRYRSFDALSDMTERALSKQHQAIRDQHPAIRELINQARSIILEAELARGESPTIATKPALAINSLEGTSTLFRIMSALNKGKLKVERSWRQQAAESRNATLTHLMKVTFPADTDTSDTFKKLAKQAIAEGYCSEERLLELTFLAPQWSKFVGETLGWEGFSEGLYWFLAHMASDDAAAENAASSEGLTSDEDDVDEDEIDHENDDDNESSDDTVQPQKLSAWEKLVLERTPLTPAERSEGAVDVAWFHRTWDQLGETRWQKMAEAAKFAANSAQANKAQFLASVLLGKTPRKDLVDAIRKKFRKESVRLLGLLPLEKGTKRDSDVLERYEVLQEYKKYARGLSSLTKPAAMRAVEIGMNNLARLAGFPDPLRMEWALEAESIRDLARGPVSVTKDGVTVSLSLDTDAKPQLTVVKDGKTMKSVPSPLRKKHPAIAELAERATELKRKSSRIRQSLENAMCRADVISASELVQLSEHAIVGPQLARLVLIGEGIAGYPDKGGKVLRRYDGKLEPVKKGESLRIAHPGDLLARGDWDKWQHDCFHAERVQPFKQIFRELYVVTKQEKKDAVASQRFAGHQIGPKQAIALWNSRGWNTQDGVCRIFHDLSLIVDVSFQYNSGTAAEVEGWTIEAVTFRNRDAYRPMKLSAVPANVFSEVMRDMDLVVSVAHRGEVDPEASASTVEMRSALIRETCQLLGLKNVKLKESHALIAGYYGDYSLHLGSGGIHRLPGGALHVVAVHAQHRGRLFLPFADDDPRTAEIMSKVLLLARDEEIMDPMILDQLGAPVGKRRLPVTSATSGSKASGEKTSAKPKAARPDTESTPTTAQATAVGGYGRRRLQFEEGSSSKFWEVSLDGTNVTTRWGRIGSDGQSRTKDFGSAEKAKAEYDKLLREKIGKGYVES